MPEVITNNLDLWTSALLTKSTAGRGNSGKLEAYGIKKLRELILELAVRGKLVPQDPNDEPANVLLKRVTSEKAQMAKDGKIRKEKDFSPIAEDEISFSLPVGWEWARINDIGHDWGQKTPDADFTYIDVSAIDNNLGVIKEPSVLSASEAPSRARKIVQTGTVIYSTVRPYLKNICVIEDAYSPEPIASTAFAVLHPLQGMPGRFFAFYFRSPEFVKYVESVQTGIAYPAINDKQFYGGLVPIPPLAEQHRIVAKVDELMALCDQLEQQQTHSIEAHQALVTSLLGTFTRVESQQEFSAAWVRIASHFDTLFTTEASIDQLKQTILQLAVMGKLVPQNPNDEPTSELLQKIAAGKARLIKEGKIKKDKPLPEIREDEKPYVLPQGWEWVRLGGLLSKIGAGSTPLGGKQVYVKEGVKFLRSQNVWDDGLRLNDVAYITPATHERMSGTVVNAKDILFNITGASIGRCALVADDFDEANVSQHVTIIRPLDESIRQFLHTVLISQHVQKAVMDVQVGVSREGLSIGKLALFLIPFPPCAEQHRIVAKVDELMALCDALKARLAEAQAIQLHLADAIVEQAVC